ncbi:MAG: hypothetical protein P5679_22080 [Limnospira sp. PMC 1249.20]|nr:hypothetical protein [Limnospira sp. PMC 1249.20]MDT9246652.1 hypothetical protein [Limnospira sp. PMC 1249.20]
MSGVRVHSTTGLERCFGNLSKSFAGYRLCYLNG